jgi:hypothetical protein
LYLKEVSNFDQTAAAKERILVCWDVGHGGFASRKQISSGDKEALVSACWAKADAKKQDLLELARAWTQAALQEGCPLIERKT